MEFDDALEEYRRSAPIDYVRPLPGGGGGGQNKKVLFLRGGVAVAAKPNESADLKKQANNEVGAYLLAKELDMGQLVSATVLRQMPAPGGGSIEGSAQVMWHRFIEAQQKFSHTDCPDEVAWTIAVFDCVAANADRNDNNWGAITRLPDAVLIDHGKCFTEASRTTSQFFVEREGEELPTRLLTNLEEFLAKSQSTRLMEVLDKTVVEQVIKRAQHLVGEGELVLP